MILERVDAALGRGDSNQPDALDEQDQEVAQELIKRIRATPQEGGND
jgi:hypothetical protein